MQREVIVGVVAVALGSVAGWLGARALAEPGEVAGVEVDAGAESGAKAAFREVPPREAEPSAAPEPEPPLELLSRCRTELQQARARARLGPAGAPRPRAVDECLADPRVRSACANPDAAAELTAPDPAAADPGQASAPPSFARSFASKVVGVGADEAEWLEDYLCTVHGMREDMVAELEAMLDAGAADVQVEALIEDAKHDRAAMLADLEQELGAERYAALRGVGGLGIMGAALDCSG